MREKNTNINWQDWENHQDITSKQGVMLAFNIDPNNILNTTLDFERHYQLKRYYRHLRSRSRIWTLQKLESELKVFQERTRQSKASSQWTDRVARIAIAIEKDNKNKANGHPKHLVLINDLKELLETHEYIKGVDKIIYNFKYNYDLKATDVIDTFIGAIVKAERGNTCADINTDGFLPTIDAINLVVGKPADLPMNSGNPGWTIYQDTISSYWKQKDQRMRDCRGNGIHYVHFEDFLRWVLSIEDELPDDTPVWTPERLEASRKSAQSGEKIQEIDKLLKRFAKNNSEVGLKPPQQDAANDAGNADPLSCFNESGNFRFKKAKIRIDPDNLVLRISDGNANATIPFSVLKLTKKNEITLNSQGRTFMEIARGNFNSVAPGAETAISRLSKNLRNAFKTTDTPFLKSCPQFKLVIPKDRKAKNTGESQPASFNEAIHGANYKSPEMHALGYTPENADDYLKAIDHEYDSENPMYDDDPDLGAGD